MFISQHSNLQDVIKELPTLIDILSTIDTKTKTQLDQANKLNQNNWAKSEPPIKVGESPMSISGRTVTPTFYELRQATEATFYNQSNVNRMIENAEKLIPAWEQHIAQLAEAVDLCTEWRKEQQELRDRVINLLVSLGFRKTVTYRKNRNSIKTHTKDADWLKELYQAIPVDDGHHNRMLESKRNLATYKDALQSLKVYKHRQDYKLEENARKETHRVKLEAIKIIYGLDGSDVWSCIREVTEKDKYLKLASMMLEAREDFSYTSTVIDYLQQGNFEVECEDDRLILEDLLQYEDERDGRCFRDCAWNYTIIFNMADEQLYDCYNKLKELE